MPAPAPAPTPVPAREPAPTVAPYDLLDAVRRAQGVDISDVPIRRGPEVADEARLLGARSFTRDAEVFLPAQEGSPDGPVARGLLAHELTHAAQQRALGSALPAEDSEAGRALEAQAVAAERWARGLGADPAMGNGFGANLTAGGGLFGAGARGTAVPSLSPTSSASSMSWTAPWYTAPTAGVQRQAGDVTSLAESEYAGAPVATMAPGAMSESNSAPNSASSSSSSQASAAASGADSELGAARDRLIELSRQRPLDLDDPGDIEELAGRIYQRIHRRLRRDLVVDRERAGRLGESGPFGAAR